VHKSVQTAAFGGNKVRIVSGQLGSYESFAFGALYDSYLPSYRWLSNRPLSPKKPFANATRPMVSLRYLRALNLTRRLFKPRANRLNNTAPS
jgi:hypothetical protein